MTAVRVYLSVDAAALPVLQRTGALPAGSFEVHLPAGQGEDAEYDAMRAAAEAAASAHPHPVVVAADVEDTTSHVAGADVLLSDVASFHVGDDLAWYATQELGPLLDELGV